MAEAHFGSSPPNATLTGGEDVDPSEVRASARRLVLRRLERREHTRAELAAILARRGMPADVVEDVLDAVACAGLVDDSRFAQAWVEIRGRDGNRSARAMGGELQRRGVSPEVIADTLAGYTEQDELRGAQALASRRFRTVAGGDPIRLHRRVMGALARRGYPLGICLQVAAEVVAQSEGEPLTGAPDENLS